MKKSIEAITNYQLEELCNCVREKKFDRNCAMSNYIGYLCALKDVYLLSTKEYGELLCKAKEAIG